MHNVLSSLKTFVKDATDYNAATLSGAVDVITVKHEDGTFRSTPWHVRFGKFQVFKSKRKPVKIFVNGEEAPFQMKLGSEGEAYFVEESEHPVENSYYATSPLASPLSSPEISPMASPRSQPDESLGNFDLESGAQDPDVTPTTKRSLSDGDLARTAAEATGNKSEDRGSLSDYFRRAMSLGGDDKAGTQDDAKSSGSADSDLDEPGPIDLFPARGRSMSSSRPWSSCDTTNVAADFVYPTNLRRERITVRRTFEQAIAISSAFQVVVWEFATRSYNIGFSVEFQATNEESGAHEKRLVQELRRVDSHKSAVKGLFLSPCAGILLLKWDNTFSKLRNKNLKYMVYHVGSAAESMTDINAEDEAYKSPSATPLASPAEHSEGNIPASIHFAVDTFFGPGRLAVPCTETSPTVGVHLDNGSSTGHHIVCYCDRSRVVPLANDSSLTFSSDRNVDYRARCTTYNWDHTQAAWVPYFPGDDDSDARRRTGSGSSDNGSPNSGRKVRPLADLNVATASASDSEDASMGAAHGPFGEQKHFMKSVNPTSEQMAMLNLRPGSNTLAFEVYSRLQGRSRIEATLFMWSPTAKVVISDVDGTITKSDVMGHVMFMIGRDWTHNGVAPLYAKIAENGYKFVYLTSRNIGQVDNTKMYLRNISQDKCKLPPGAVITSPDRLFAALNREMVQRRPQEFKITALRDVRHCFADTHNPFYAGFGNRATDVVSYRAVGVAEGRIYIINPAGEIRHFNHMYRSSYTSLQQLVDVMFPAFSDGSDGDTNAGARKFQDSSFSSYNYWKTNAFQFDDV